VALSAVGNTPIVWLRAKTRLRTIRLALKLESHNPTGSSKDRTAKWLLDDLDRAGRLDPGTILVESTSGNLGLALALAARARDLSFLAVVDPKLTDVSAQAIERLGGRLEMVDEPDHAGGYLLTRLRRLQEILDAEPCAVWPNQYENLANPLAHYESTGPEILRGVEGPVDAIVVPVSTGGTLAGIARYAREVSPQTAIVAVDSAGSVVLGTEPGPRLLTGIGSSRPSPFLDPSLYDAAIITGDAEAMSFCTLVADCTGLRLGGSSGATMAAATRYATATGAERIVCLCPDGGDRYGSTIYSDRWRAANGVQIGWQSIEPVRDVVLEA
jgi:N-(2-amino-2-carboxyethyl)-L-glutamate synthase